MRYIVVGDFAATFHGYTQFTGAVDIWLKETSENRKNFRKAYADYGIGDFESIETIQFVPGWVDFPLLNGMTLHVQTNLKGIDLSFNKCFEMAPIIKIEGVEIPFLNLNHLIANKKAVARPKDLLDVINLEKIKKLNEDYEAG